MDRSTRRMAIGIGAGITLTVALGPMAGCNAVATALWVLKDGKTASAEYKGLNNKKIAVIARGPMSIRFRHEQTAPQLLAKRVGQALKANLGRKTTIIPQEKIAKITDEREWDQFTEVGKEVGAEMVVAIDVESFTINRGGSVYRGQATIDLTVYDMTKEGEEAYKPKQRLDSLVYPPVIEGIPATDMSEKQFVDKFINYLAQQIGQKFYDYDPMADFAGYGL
jgi:hypothetical protein